MKVSPTACKQFIFRMNGFAMVGIAEHMLLTRYHSEFWSVARCLVMRCVGKRELNKTKYQAALTALANTSPMPMTLRAAVTTKRVLTMKYHQTNTTKCLPVFRTFLGAMRPARMSLSPLIWDAWFGVMKGIHVDPNWRTSTVIGLAEAMYKLRNFANMPILADALEEAGCDQQDILKHCREFPVFTRGSWIFREFLPRTRR